MNSHCSFLLVIPPYNLYPPEKSFELKPLEISVEPMQRYKLRYHSDYEKNPTRRGVIRSNNNPTYRGPTIKVCSFFQNLSRKTKSEFSLVLASRFYKTILHPG